jgi:hypothetical protein
MEVEDSKPSFPDSSFFYRMQFNPWQRFIRGKMLENAKRGKSRQILPFPRFG